MILYAVKDWNTTFETSRTLGTDKTRGYKALKAVMFPNKHDGEGYTALVTLDKRGVEDFGVWIAIVQVASKCEPRGVLIKDDGTPHDAQSLSLKTRMPVDKIEHAISRLIAAPIEWLITTESGQETQEPMTPAVIEPANDKPLSPTKRIGYDLTERCYTGFTQADVDFLADTYPAVDIVLAIKASGAWLTGNPSKMKVNLWRFVLGWLGRAQEQGKHPRKGGAPGINTGWESMF